MPAHVVERDWGGVRCPGPAVHRVLDPRHAGPAVRRVELHESADRELDPPARNRDSRLARAGGRRGHVDPDARRCGPGGPDAVGVHRPDAPEVRPVRQGGHPPGALRRVHTSARGDDRPEGRVRGDLDFVPRCQVSVRVGDVPPERRWSRRPALVAGQAVHGGRGPVDQHAELRLRTRVPGDVVGPIPDRVDPVAAERDGRGVQGADAIDCDVGPRNPRADVGRGQRQTGPVRDPPEVAHSAQDRVEGGGRGRSGRVDRDGSRVREGGPHAECVRSTDPPGIGAVPDGPECVRRQAERDDPARVVDARKAVRGELRLECARGIRLRIRVRPGDDDGRAPNPCLVHGRGGECGGRIVRDQREHSRELRVPCRVDAPVHEHDDAMGCRVERTGVGDRGPAIQSVL